MRSTHFVPAGFTAAVVLGIGLALTIPRDAPAQDTVPRMSDGKPDLSGVWWGGGDVGGPGFRPGGPPLR
jgi:hypothetical protein